MRGDHKLEDYDDMIKTMARKFLPSFRRQVTFEDLCQIGRIVFFELQRDPNPIPVLFKTALRVKIQQTIILELRAINRLRHYPAGGYVSIEVIERFHYTYDPYPKIDRYLDLPEEAREVIKILFELPDELLTIWKTFAPKPGLNRYLKTHRGWSQKKIKKFWCEISGKPILY